MGIAKIDNLSANCYLNNAIDSLNKTIGAYNEIVEPVEEAAKTCLKSTKLDKTGANAKHVFLGVLLSAASDKNTSLDDLKKEVQILEQKPWVKYGEKFKKWDGLSEALPEWIGGYIEAPPKLEEVANQMADMPEDIEKGVTEAPEDFKDLGTADKMKAMAQSTKTAKQMK
jgi:hypothetical protein